MLHYNERNHATNHTKINKYYIYGYIYIICVYININILYIFIKLHVFHVDSRKYYIK